MALKDWKLKELSVAGLHLDQKNPRLGRETFARAPREIIQYLFEHDKAIQIAESIACRGYFLNEPLLAVQENGKNVVIEGNRRLAALKALREPGLLEGTHQRQVERFARKIINLDSINRVPVIIAPNRRSTDRQIAGRHIGTPVLSWQAENRASFILDKISEGYTNDELREDLGFTPADIQQARQTRAIADMTRSLVLPEEIKAKVENPRAKLFTTIERIFESTVGRQYLKVEPDAEYGIKGKTTVSDFRKGFTKLVTDIVLGKQSSRSLNRNEDIEAYFKTWDKRDLPTKKGSFIPSEIIQGIPGGQSSAKAPKKTSPKKTKKENLTIIPASLKVIYGNARLIDIRKELIKINREHFPNVGAVLMRVFFELSVFNYLERCGEIANIISIIGKKTGGRISVKQLKLSNLIPEILKIAKKKLSPMDLVLVEKALRYDPSAPFTISDLHGFVHSSDFPSPRDIYQFWNRTEPLFRLMLEQEIKP